MALEIRQQLKLSQQLVMTPQLQQAIKLLQLSRTELEAVIRQELEENPILEEGLENLEEKEEPGQAKDENEAAASEEVKELKENPEEFNDVDWQTYLEGYHLGGGGTSAELYEGDDDRPSYENLLTKKSSLADHLRWQLNLSRLEDHERLAAAEIIGNLDESGYLKASFEEIAEATGLSAPVVERALEAVQDFDPPAWPAGPCRSAC